MELPKIKVGGFLGQMLKMAVIQKLSELADSVTPEDIEKRIDLDKWIVKIENDPKYADLKPFLVDMENKSNDAGRSIALLVDAILDLLPAIVANIKM